jgi:hypothetical protein
VIGQEVNTEGEPEREGKGLLNGVAHRKLNGNGLQAGAKLAEGEA